MTKKNSSTASLRYEWWILLAIAAVVFVFLMPYSEFTTDDGSWILDSWLRIKDHDWFSLWIPTSQEVPNFPLVSLIFAAPLSLWKSITAVQVMIVGVQLATLVLIRQIALQLSLRFRGIIAGTLFLFLPALTLNYSSKLCNPSFIVFASAFLFWSLVQSESRKRWALIGLSLVFSIQIHYSFAIFLLPLFLEILFLRGPMEFRVKALQWCGAAVAALLVLASLIPQSFPHLRSLMDLVVAGSPLMLGRSDPGAHLSQTFFPWEMIPVFASMIAMPAGIKDHSRQVLWLYWVASLIALFLLGFVTTSAPHHWVLVSVLPALLLFEIGAEILWDRFGGGILVLFLALVAAECGIQSFRVWSQMSTSGGTGWHESSLSVKREVVDLISKKYPNHRILLAATPNPWRNGVMAWDALLSLPEQFTGKPALRTSGTLFIEERYADGAYPYPLFSSLAEKSKWKLVSVCKNVFLWETPELIDGTWARVAPISTRIDWLAALAGRR